jgi:hypothetical protein
VTEPHKSQDRLEWTQGRCWGPTSGRAERGAADTRHRASERAYRPLMPGPEGDAPDVEVDTTTTAVTFDAQVRAVMARLAPYDSFEAVIAAVDQVMGITPCAGWRQTQRVRSCGSWSELACAAVCRFAQWTAPLPATWTAVEAQLRQAASRTRGRWWILVRRARVSEGEVAFYPRWVDVLVLSATLGVLGLAGVLVAWPLSVVFFGRTPTGEVSGIVFCAIAASSLVAIANAQAKRVFVVSRNGLARRGGRSGWRHGWSEVADVSAWVRPGGEDRVERLMVDVCLCSEATEPLSLRTMRIANGLRCVAALIAALRWAQQAEIVPPPDDPGRTSMTPPDRRRRVRPVALAGFGAAALAALAGALVLSPWGGGGNSTVLTSREPGQGRAAPATAILGTPPAPVPAGQTKAVTGCQRRLKIDPPSPAET